MTAPLRDRSNGLNRRSHSNRGGIWGGCLIALGIVVLLVIIGVVFVAINFKSWAVSGFASVTKIAVNEMPLPEQEKPEINAIIDRLAGAVKAGDVTLEEATQIFEGLEASPFLAMGSVAVFEGSYLAPSGLTEEEKTAASLALNRVAQGVIAGTITTQEIETLLAPVQTPTAEGWEFKDPSEVTDDELRAVIAAATVLADERGVPAERVEVDLSDALEQSIEESLGRPLP